MLEYDRSKRKWILYTRDGSRILGTHKTKKDALRQERAILWSQSKRKNPSAEWFETQRLQNDADGYLINPDTNDIYWFHGSPGGGLTDNPPWQVLYLSSSVSSAVEFACLGYSEEFPSSGFTPVILQMTLRLSPQQVFDIRNAGADPRIEALSKQLGMNPKRRVEDRLWYLHYDNTLGYHATPDQHKVAQSFGFLGWLETELQPSLGVNIPCTIGIYTDVQPPIYQVVAEADVYPEDCSQARSNPFLEVREGKLVNPDTGDTRWFHGSWVGKLKDFQSETPRSHTYTATFFTSEEDLAADFASGERAWLGFDEDPPPMKRSGYVHKVEIDDIKLIDPDRMIVDSGDADEVSLTPEGVAFAQAMQDSGASEEEISGFFHNLKGRTYHAFSRLVGRWEPVLAAMEALGYRGWYEKESFYRTHTNIGLLHPDEDATLRGGYTTKRTRKF
jgi:hypothetical protein